MSVTVERVLQGLEAGDVVPLDQFETEHGSLLKRLLLDELEARGFVLDSKNVLGEVEICGRCNGDGEVKGKCCSLCDGYSTTINYGRGAKPYRQ